MKSHEQPIHPTTRTHSVGAGAELMVRTERRSRRAGFEDLAPGLLVDATGVHATWAQALWIAEDDPSSMEEYADSLQPLLDSELALGNQVHPLLSCGGVAAARTWEELISLDALTRLQSEPDRVLPGGVRLHLVTEAARAIELQQRGVPGYIDPDGPLSLPFTRAGEARGRLKPLLGQSNDPSRVGVLRGELWHLAPEEVRGVRPSPATAVFKLAHVIFHLFHPGRPPVFARRSSLDTLVAIAKEGAPTLPDDTPPALRKLLCAAWAREPGDRPGTPRELVAALRDVLPFDVAEPEVVARALGEIGQDEFDRQRSDLAALVEEARPVVQAGGQDDESWEGETEVWITVRDPHRATLQLNVDGHQVILDEDLVSRGDWALYALETGAARGASAGGDPDAPMVGVTWSEAAAYASWANKRLPALGELQMATRLHGVDATGATPAQWTAEQAPPAWRLVAGAQGDAVLRNRSMAWWPEGRASAHVGFRCALDVA